MADPDLSLQSVPISADDLADQMLAVALGLGLPVTSWPEGSPWLALLLGVADGGADLSLAIARIAANAYVGPGGASGIWLMKALRSHYAEEIKPPGFTIGTVLLQDHGGGPHSIGIGAFIVATEDEKLQYRVAALPNGGTVPLNGSLEVTVKAFAVGGKYNVPNGSVTKAITAAPTLTVGNPEVGTSGTWISQLGVDIESGDAATVRAPMKWATLATGSPRAAYLFWALSTPGVTRATVDDNNPDGANTNRVYIDNAASVLALQATLDAKVPDGTRSTAMAATNENVVIPGTVTVKRAFRDQAASEIQANITALQNSTDIGALIIEAELTEQVMMATGVVDFQLNNTWVGTPNHQLADSAIVQFTLALTWVLV